MSCVIVPLFFINIILTGVFCHSLVCFWSQEIEKRNICHSLTLILEIFLVKLYILYNRNIYPHKLIIAGIIWGVKLI